MKDFYIFLPYDTSQESKKERTLHSMTDTPQWPNYLLLRQQRQKEVPTMLLDILHQLSETVMGLKLYLQWNSLNITKINCSHHSSSSSYPVLVFMVLRLSRTPG